MEPKKDSEVLSLQSGDTSTGRVTYDLCSTALSPDECLRCLKGEVDVIIPTPSAKACNNLEEYLYRSTCGSKKAQSTSKRTPSSQSSVPESSPNTSNLSQSEPFAVPLVRNFDRILKKQDNLLGECPGLVTRKRKQQLDVFTKIDQIKPETGPINVLKNRLNQHIKVLIRRRRKVPYISRVIEYKGELVLFDKHMNLYLKDVIESFTFSLSGRLHRRARHRDNLFLRGDNVILVI